LGGFDEGFKVGFLENQNSEKRGNMQNRQTVKPALEVNVLSYPIPSFRHPVQ